MSVPWDAARGDIVSVKSKTIFFSFFSFNAASWGGRDEGDGHLNWDHTAAGRQHAHGHTELRADRRMQRVKGKKNPKKKGKKKAVKRLMKRLPQPRQLNDSSSSIAFSFPLFYLSLAEDDCSLHPFLPFRG